MSSSPATTRFGCLLPAEHDTTTCRRRWCLGADFCCPDLQVTSLGTRGIRSLAVARTVPDDLTSWEVLGMLTFLDPPRPDTKRTIEQVRPAPAWLQRSVRTGRCGTLPRLLVRNSLHFLGVPGTHLLSLSPCQLVVPGAVSQALENGVDVKMITGDQVLIAKEMSR